MNIAFDNLKHGALVNDSEALRKKYNKKKGIDSASDILSAMNVLQAADTLADVSRIPQRVLRGRCGQS